MLFKVGIRASLAWFIGPKQRGQEKNLGRTDGGSSTQSLTRRTVEELEELIKDKLTTGFFGVRQAFRANDPRGRGSVSREAFTTILYHLCGYVSPSLVSSLLQRIGVESPSSISFDDFISHFRDNEVVQKEWLDPVLRPVRQGAHLPANQLRDSQRERSNVEQHEKRKQGLRKTLPVFYTALQVFPLLKRKAQGGLGEFARFLPDSCFDVDGMVLKPQLRQALFLMDIHMYDDEFDKVWDRIDRSGLGTVDSRTFFLTLGLGGNEGKEKQHQKSPIKEQVLEDKPDSVQPASCAKQDSPKTVIPVTVDECQEEKEDIMAVLSNKFKEGYNGIVEMFSRYDPENTGKVSKHELRQVLASYRLTLGPIEVEHFLSRFGCRHDEMVPYRKILDMCQDRTDKGLLQKIMEDPKHRFNKSRDSQIGTTTAVDAEARLLDLLHSDFLSLLGAFKSLDRENMGVVKKYQFKELLEARFGIRLNKEQLAAIRLRIGDDPASGLVPYPRFLEEFNHIRRFSPDRAVEARAATANSQRPSTCPSHPPLVRGGLSPRGVESGATQLDVKKEPESRDADQVFCSM
ncbi:predicted protein [Nematostella vectensis]|uniref:EF-hand domain-containing protein n=1 Tax=Nematostella vectensis TaxID=45351 RepID=A7SHJ6_NEMVE|nr:predicted protein [Nematostella vectensis]|eukprot:XP_001628873.1 predicted protein [Nematostella vectensis]